MLLLLPVMWVTEATMVTVSALPLILAIQGRDAHSAETFGQRLLPVQFVLCWRPSPSRQRGFGNSRRN
eukprot:6661083-Pyramimonas_sp.AAC.1